MKINAITEKVTELYREYVIHELRILRSHTIVAAVSYPHDEIKAVVFQPKETADEGAAWHVAHTVKELGGDGEGMTRAGEDAVFTHYEFPLPNH